MHGKYFDELKGDFVMLATHPNTYEYGFFQYSNSSSAI
jgi:hypothetical protein